MKFASARSIRASCPRSATNRAPLIFAAASKSIMEKPLGTFSASPRSAWSFGLLIPFGVPQRLFSRLPCSSAPSGTSSSGRFGRPIRMSSSAARFVFSSASAASMAVFASATSAIRRAASASSFLAFACPISFEFALRALSASCLAVVAARQAVSSSRMRETVSSPSPALRRFQALRKTSGVSRIARISNMGFSALKGQVSGDRL